MPSNWYYVEPVPIVTELGAGVVGTRHAVARVEAFPRNAPADNPVILRRLAAQHAQLLAHDRHSIGSAGRVDFPADGPSRGIDRMNAARLARPHPEGGAIPGERLRFRCGRSEAVEFADVVHDVEG